MVIILKVNKKLARFWDDFDISLNFVYFIFIKTTLNLHMTNSKV